MTNSQPRSRSPRRASRQAAKLTLLQVHRQVAKTSLKRMIKTPVASFMTLFVFAVSLLLPALLFSLNNNPNKESSIANWGYAGIILFIGRFPKSGVSAPVSSKLQIDLRMSTINTTKLNGVSITKLN